MPAGTRARLAKAVKAYSARLSEKSLTSSIIKLVVGYEQRVFAPHENVASAENSGIASVKKSQLLNPTEPIYEIGEGQRIYEMGDGQGIYELGDGQPICEIGDGQAIRPEAPFEARFTSLPHVGTIQGDLEKIDKDFYMADNDLESYWRDLLSSTGYDTIPQARVMGDMWLSDSTTSAHHHRESTLSSLGSAGPASPYNIRKVDTKMTDVYANELYSPDSMSLFKSAKVVEAVRAEAAGEQSRVAVPTSSYTKTTNFKRKALAVVINNKKCYARPDSASDQDIMSSKFATENNIPIQREESDKNVFKLGAGSYVRSIGRAYVPFKLFGRGSEEHRWFHVLKKCPVPLIMGMRFLEKIALYTKNKHLLVDCPFGFGSMPMLKWIGSPRGFVDFRADGKQLVGCADTGSDLDFMSLGCARRLGLRIDSRASSRTRVMLADESVVETLGQVTVSPVEVLYFDGFEMTFNVLPGLASDVIFSEEFLEQMDAFNTCAQIKESQDPYQQRVNTLINLGPIQAFLSRTWRADVEDTAQQMHDRVIEAEIYRRNKANRTIRKMRDVERARAARTAEEANKRAFDRGDDRCAHCIGELAGTGR